MRWIKRCCSKVRFLFVESKYQKKGIPRLHEAYMKEHETVIKEIRQSKRESLHEVADVILKLSAVTDNLETTLEGLKDGDGDEVD